MAYFAAELLKWYKINKRDLPWRETNDPYKIWLSEVLLQQTRVAQGLPYYQKFIQAFPTIHELANASEQEILKLWEGLGYYSRARNLHQAAKQIVHEYLGAFPSTFIDLLRLKGVGTYTAAAIASFAFNEQVAVVDGNVYRVLSRYFGIEKDITSGEGQREFAQTAKSQLPEGQANIYNQAIMEFGALHCTPANPACSTCPLQEGCVANKNNIQHLLPVKLKKITKKNRYFHYLIFRHKDTFLLKERKDKDIWKGLYEFLLIEKSEEHALHFLLQDLPVNYLVKEKVQEIHQEKYLLTHQTIFSKGFVLPVEDKKAWSELKDKFHLEEYRREELENLPKPVLISKYLSDL